MNKMTYRVLFVVGLLLTPVSFVFADQSFNFGTVSPNDWYPIGQTSYTSSGIPFVPTSSGFNYVTFTGSFFKSGTPPNDLVVSVINDVAGTPTGSSMGSGSLAPGSFTGSCDNYTWTFPVATLTSGVTYWLRFDTVGTSGTDYYNWCMADGHGTTQDVKFSGTWYNLHTFQAVFYGDVYGGMALSTVSGGGGGATSTAVIGSGNVYIFEIVSVILFLIQLCAYLFLFYVIALIVGWPIKLVFRRLKQIIRRAEYD